MPKGRNKILLLAVCLALPYCTVLLLLGMQWHARLEMEEGLEKKAAITIHIPIDEVQWLVPGKELRTGGRMFDVKTATRKGDTLILRGLYDDAEHAIRDAVQHCAQQQQQENRGNLQAFFALAGHLFTEPFPELDFSYAWHSSHGILRTSFRSHPDLAVVAPPPEVS